MNNDKEQLSIKKTEFLKAQVYNEFPLTLHDTMVLAEDYSQKHNITIFVAGNLAAKGIVVHQYFAQGRMQGEGSDSELEFDDTKARDEKTTINAVNNILSIQKTLQPNQYVGYLHTSAVKGLGHFECFIISSNEIIKPISWSLNDLGFENPNVMGDVFLHAPDYRYSFIPDEDNDDYLPQADNYSCASICLSYLKNLLKNDAIQLREHSLSLPYYDSHAQLCYFFIPSPAVLRYTQVSAYNKRIKELVESDGSTSLVHMLNSCIEQTKSSTKLRRAFKNKVIAEAKSHLNALSVFRQKWLMEYARVDAKRELMQNEKNRYLNYTAQRLTIKSHLIQQKDNNPALQLLQIFGSVSSELKKEYLQTELPKINFRTPYEVAYFLSKIEDDFRLQSFFLLKSSTFQHQNWHFITTALNAAQKQQLINDLKRSSQIGELILYKASTIFSWLELLHCTMDEIKYFIGLFVPINIARNQLIRLQKNDLHVFIKKYCAMLDNPAYLFNLLSVQVVVALTKQNNFSLWRLLEYIESNFPAEIAPNFLMRHRFSFIEEFLYSNDKYFSLNHLLIKFDALMKQADFFNLATPDCIAHFKQLILNEGLKNKGDRLAVFFNQLHFATRINLFDPILIVLQNKDNLLSNNLYRFVVNILRAMPLEQRQTFLESALGGEEKTAGLIEKYDLHFLMCNTSDLDLNIPKPRSTMAALPTDNRSRKRPFGEASDFDFYFFPAGTAQKLNAELSSDLLDMNYS